jgi:hypothetical protein
MCGRAKLDGDVSELKIKFSISPEYPAPNFPPSYNVAAPGSYPNCLGTDAPPSSAATPHPTSGTRTGVPVFQCGASPSLRLSFRRGIRRVSICARLHH